MPFVWISMAKDLRRLAREPLGMAAAVGLPLVITLLVTLIFGGSRPRACLLVADEDDTPLSALLRTAFSRQPLDKVVSVEGVSWQEGRRRLDRGDGSALLLIPEGFEQAVLRQKPCRLRLLTNPAQRILPALIKEALAVLVDGGHYAQLLLGDQLRAFADGLPPDRVMADTTVSLVRLVRKLRAYLTPPRIKLKTEHLAARQPETSTLGLCFFPGMLFLAVLLVGQARSADIWKEKTFGTLRRTALTPSRLEAFLAGKLLATALVCASVAVIGLAGASWLLDLPVTNPVTAVLWVTLAGMGLSLFQLVLNLLVPTERAGTILTTLAICLFGMAGGTFFPFEMMPQRLAAFGKWTPNGWAIVEFKAILNGSLPGPELVIAFVAALAIGAAAFLIVAHRLRRTLTA